MKLKTCPTCGATNYVDEEWFEMIDEAGFTPNPKPLIAYERAMRYGVQVWEDTEMDHLRHVRCLCLNCTRTELCKIATEGLALCKRYSIAYMVTRCPHFDKEELL